MLYLFVPPSYGFCVDVEFRAVEFLIDFFIKVYFAISARFVIERDGGNGCGVAVLVVGVGRSGGWCGVVLVVLVWCGLGGWCCGLVCGVAVLVVGVGRSGGWCGVVLVGLVWCGLGGLVSGN